MNSLSANGQPFSIGNPMPVTVVGQVIAAAQRANALVNRDQIGGAGISVAVGEAQTAATVARVVASAQEAADLAKQANTPEKVQALKLAGEAITNISDVINNKTNPAVSKLGESSALTAEQIAANRKTAEIEGGPTKKPQRDKLFDAALTKEGLAGDFQSGFQSALMNPFKKSSWGDAGMGFLKDIQARAAHDLSSMLTGSLFGTRDKDTGKLSGGLLSSLFGSLFGKHGGGWGSFNPGFPGAPGSASGGGSLLSRLFGSLFGGGRASGGDVSGGRFYMFGEHGPELGYIGAGASGHIYNASQTRGMMSGGRSQRFIFVDSERAAEEHFNASDETLIYRLAAIKNAWPASTDTDSIFSHEKHHRISAERRSE